MSPADLIPFARHSDGRETEVQVEEPLSRAKLLEMVLAASLLLEEAHFHLSTARGRLRRRIELLRLRMEDAIAREAHAQSVVASRPVLPTVEDAEK